MTLMWVERMIGKIDGGNCLVRSYGEASWWMLRASMSRVLMMTDLLAYPFWELQSASSNGREVQFHLIQSGG